MLRKVCLGELMVHCVEYFLNGILAESALAEHIFVAGDGVHLHHSDTGAFLTAVVLLLHQKIELVDTVGISTVFLLVIFKWLQ